MKKSSLIGHTIEVYDAIVQQSYPADSVINSFFRSHKYLGSRDRRFIAETTYGMLRYKKKLEWILSFTNHSSTKHLCFLYLTIFSQEKFLEDEISENLQQEFHQAVTKSTVVLSKEKSITKISLEYSFPEWIIEEWISSFGEEETKKLCEVINTPPPLTLRVNTIKCSVEECQQALLSEGITTERTQYSPFGLILKKRINVFQLSAFNNGFFEVQDEGSQLLPLLIDPKPTAKIIDACAGAGGKTLELSALMKNRGTIYALDIHSRRLEELRKRIRRSGADNIRVMTIEEEKISSELIGTADAVLIDSPCSGTGTLRRNPGMKWTVVPSMIDELNAKQQNILELYSQCVKPNGIVVYATCSLLRQENENVVEQFLSTHPNFVVEDFSAKLERYNIYLSPKKYFQLFPHIHNTDGFFAVVMRKVA